ncbi:conserved hypothetical protein [Coccidioides posadasii str. Silveira]|uniref:Uncharacterized protein n=1 Tax=Coccidioides posadasii (strain RMSCC 757 / Silveira) TaxID=443226 RepID=E9CVU4_COCPS|nr:conserved hypothetical protein [Coccidioides posadasii str. Silveira]
MGAGSFFANQPNGQNVSLVRQPPPSSTVFVASPESQTLLLSRPLVFPDEVLKGKALFPWVYDDASQSRVMDTWEEGLQFASTPGYFGCTLMLDSLSPTPDCALQTHDHLEFLPLAKWVEGKDYEKQSPNYICYTIAWRIIINHRVETRETEQDLIIAPCEYWEKCL